LEVGIGLAPKSEVRKKGFEVRSFKEALSGVVFG